MKYLLLQVLLLAAIRPLFGQFYLPFQIDWAGYPWAKKTVLVERCYKEEYFGKHAIEKKGKNSIGYYYLFDTLGRHTHTSFGKYKTPDLVKDQVWVYDETGCPFIRGSGYSDSRRTYFGDTTGDFFHCENGWLDTIFFEWIATRNIRLRDSAGRLGEFQIWHGDSLFHREKYQYDSFGNIISISGTVNGKVEYLDNGRKVRFVGYYPKWNEWAISYYYLDESGLLIRAESGDSRIDPKRPRPDMVNFYEWKLREPK